jgi:uncharacterized protein (DUF885 family)
MRFYFRRPVFVLLALLTALTCAIAQPRLHSATRLTPAIERSNRATEQFQQSLEGKTCRRDFPAELFKTFDQTFGDCQRQQLSTTLKTLQASLTSESDFAVQQDLQLLIHEAELLLRKDALEKKYYIADLDLTRQLTRYFTTQIAKGDANQALTQLRRFAGEMGQPLTAIALSRIRAHLASADLYLSDQIRTDLSPQQTQANLQHLRQAFEQSQLRGYAAALNQLETQLTDYNQFLRQSVLPQAKIGFRLQPDLYALRLEEQGVAIPIEELIAQSRSTFGQVQQEMNAIAAKIAQQRGLQQTDYREIIRVLKQEQLSPKAVLELYQQRQRDIEAIIRQHQLVTLPKRGLTIRLATAAENDSFPVPRYYSPSRNREGVFIIPVLANRQDYDDFTYPAVTWTLTAHEGRPGHDLQFATIQDYAISKVRSQSFKAASHEGWALYAEALTKPYMPLEGQLISLQFQLLRAARAFLEPELHLGRMTIPEARRVLMQDAGYSRFFADQEIQRYTTRTPGQAPAYFYGFYQLIQLRQTVEAQLGSRFNAQQFHDLILAQGFLPPELLRIAVLKNTSS